MSCNSDLAGSRVALTPSSWTFFVSSPSRAGKAQARRMSAQGALNACSPPEHRRVHIPRGQPGRKMSLPPMTRSLVLWFSLLVLQAASQHCHLNRARDQQPLDPSIPSPSNSINSSTVSPTGTSHPQPSNTPFVYGRDKIRGVNLYVVSSFPVIPTRP